MLRSGAVKLSIPTEQLKLMKDWLGDEYAERNEKLIDALEKMAPALIPDILAKQLAAEIGVPMANISEVMDMFMSLYRTDHSCSNDTERTSFRGTIVGMIAGTVAEAQARTRVQGRIDRLLASKSIHVTGKALGVMRGSANRYCKAQTLSELRPIFHDEPLTAEAAVIVHELHITYHSTPNEARHEIFISLDKQDLEALSQVIQRALNKHALIVELANGGKSLKVLTGDEV